jgi:hypothetical protein
MSTKPTIAGDCLATSVPDGAAFIEAASPLTRLHYFDGQYLRADALALEQDYQRAQNRLSNLAGGWGVVNGLGVSSSGALLEVTPGFAITPLGNPVLAVGTLSAAIADLLKVAVAAAVAQGNCEFGDCLETKPGAKPSPAMGIFEITVGPAESLCGNEAVYGKLCDSACASDSQHPWWREGVALRLRPISLSLAESTAVTLGAAHLRNRVASAYFAAEPWLTASALSAAGLANPLWCNPASLYGRDEVPLGLLAWAGGEVAVLDAWSARRERMEAQARGYWQGRMSMRPWNVFLAQILQFQCQLSGLLDGGPVIAPVDACDTLRKTLEKTRAELVALQKKYASGAKKLLEQFGEKPTKKAATALADELKGSYAQFFELADALSATELGAGALPKNRMLLNAGFMELPPAGYLPVQLGKTAIDLQLSRVFGEGVRLHYRAARADVLPHLLEEAQHMQRISLTRGLDNPQQLEDVEVFLPSGAITAAAALSAGIWWQASLSGDYTGAIGDVLDSGQVLAAQVLEQSGNVEVATANSGDANALVLLRALKINRGTLTLDTALPTDLEGLARGEARDDGSYGFALAAALVESDLSAANAISAAGIQAYEMTKEQALYRSQRRIEKVAYLAADIARDPFDLALGEVADFGLEWRGIESASIESSGSDLGSSLKYQGGVTVLGRRSLANGRVELQVMVELVGTRTAYLPANPPGSPPETRAETPRSLRFQLLRRGVASGGQFFLDDARLDPSTPSLQFDWDDNPRVAMVDLLVTALVDTSASDQKVDPATGAAAAASTPATTTTTRQRLLRLDGLEAAPAPSSRIGAAAMNSLVRLADISDDPAFLARAQRRLFPAANAAAVTTSVATLQAVEDWVMFRRLRPTFCDPVCVQPVSPGVEAFQVWHLCLDGAAALKKFQAALDQSDDTALAGYKFRRVGVLRFQDESSQPEELPATVHSMWEMAKPCPQVALARVWESDPGTGQGWQNHFRVRAMLDQITDLSALPAAGSGAISAIPKAPGPLDDRGLDGGMLVVTTAKVAATRNALMVYGGRDGSEHYPAKDAPNQPLTFLDNAPQGSALQNFIKALPADQGISGVTVATRDAPGDDAKLRLKAVLKVLVDSGVKEPDAAREVVEPLSTHDHDYLIELGMKPDDYDEILFIEP